MNNELKTTDWLAIERTKLANERTFLAYFRTSVIFLATGLSLEKIELLDEVKFLGIWLILLAPLLFGLGLYRFLRVKRKIRASYYKKES